jgi:hypothetical protein
MLCRVALVRTDVSEERSTSIIRVIRIGELGTMLAVTSNRRTMRKNIMKVLCSSETSALTRATRRTSIYLILLASLGPRVCSASNANDYKLQK